MDVFGMSGELIDENSFTMFYYLPPKFTQKQESSTNYSLIATLDRFYDHPTLNLGFQQSVFVKEILRNARWHGGSRNNSPTYLGVFYNRNKIVFGCNDGGDYFKRRDIKETWENKKVLTEFHKPERQDLGHHIGYKYITSHVDEIKIDMIQGTFYGIIDVGKYIEKIINLK